MFNVFSHPFKLNRSCNVFISYLFLDFDQPFNNLSFPFMNFYHPFNMSSYPFLDFDQPLNDLGHPFKRLWRSFKRFA